MPIKRRLRVLAVNFVTGAEYIKKPPFSDCVIIQKDPRKAVASWGSWETLIKEKRIKFSPVSILVGQIWFN